MRRHRTKVAAGAAALLAIGGAGGAVASLDGSPKEESDAIVNDAAAELGVSADELRDALETALANRIDEAVAEGRLSERRAAELKERLADGALPLVGVGPGPFGHGPGEHLHVVFFELDRAAAYLGLSEADLRERLAAGDSLAEVARDRDKSVDGLVDVLVKAAEARLDDAVEDGRLSEEREALILENLRERITDLVNGELPAPRLRPGPLAPRGPASLGAAL